MDEEPTSLLLLLYTTEEPGSESQILGYRLLDIGGKADIGGYFVFTRYPPLDTLHTFCPTVYDDKILFISFTRSRMEMRGSATYTPGAWTLPMMKMCVCVCVCVCVYVCIYGEDGAVHYRLLSSSYSIISAAKLCLWIVLVFPDPVFANELASHI